MAFADDRVVAFMDLGAVTPGHVLVVPRLHAAGLEDLDEETSMHVWRIGHRIGRALRRSGLRCEGVNAASPTARPPSRRSSTSICMSSPFRG